MAADENVVNIKKTTVERNINDSVNQQEASDHLGRLSDNVPAGTSRNLFGYTSGYTELHVAASKGYVGLLKSLLSDESNRSDVNVRTVNGGYTPLHLAASAGHAECVEELLKYDETDAHVPDEFGKTPLETAERNSKNDVTKLLRSHGKSLCATTVK